MSVQIKRAQRGVTLIEVMLVLAIASLLIVMSLRMYQSFQNDTYARQLRANVDGLFQGLSNYYWANCIQYKSGATTPITEGKLDPNSYPTPPTYPSQDVTLATLSSAGFLPRWPLPPNPLINTAASDSNTGYILQFNRNYPLELDRVIDTTIQPSQPMGKVILWRAQVAVHMKNASAYKNLLAADCASTYSGGVVAPCTATSNGDYLVWERIPSFSSPEAMETLWISAHLLEQFNQMYTTYPINKLINGKPDITSQNFLCNG